MATRHAEPVDDSWSGTRECVKRWPNARELYLSCRRCGAAGSVYVNDDSTVIWSVLPVTVERGRVEHKCPEPTATDVCRWTNPVAERLFDDMATLRYFSDDGRLATWAPALKVEDGAEVVSVPNLQTRIAGELQRDRESIDRYLSTKDHQGISRPVVIARGAPSMFPGILVRVAGAFLRALDDEESDRKRWNPPASELRQQIAELADEFRAATPKSQQPGDPLTLDQLAILRRRPLAPLNAAAATFHRDEEQQQRKFSVIYCAGTEPENDDTPADPLAAAVHVDPPGHPADSAELQRAIRTLPTEEAIAVRMKLDGCPGREIADHLGVSQPRAYRLLWRGVGQLAAEVKREQEILDAA